MPDRGKVISAYECVITRGKSVCECGKCDYHIKDSAVFFCDNQRVLTDALALLKEQEAVEPKPVHNSFRWFACGKCDCSITREDRFCPRCGRSVKWE